MTRGTRAQWTERVRRWRTSGMTADVFAAREGVNPSTLRWWRSELARAAKRGGAFVEVKLAEESRAPAAGVIEIVLGGDVRVRVPSPVDPVALRHVLCALEGR